MKRTKDIMGMPVTVEIADVRATETDLEKAFAYFRHVDATFSTYKEESEISQINRGELPLADASDEMREIFALAEATKEETNGYFDIRRPDNSIDPSGIVKGWAIRNAAQLLMDAGWRDTYVEAGGDIQTHGRNREGNEWRIGIRSPFDRGTIVKVIEPRGNGIATSGTYIRGAHIYDPHTKRQADTPFASITMIGPDVYEADRFATAAFAMGEKGILFIEGLSGFEAYAIDASGIATFTSGFQQFVFQTEKNSSGESFRDSGNSSAGESVLGRGLFEPPAGGELPRHKTDSPAPNSYSSRNSAPDEAAN